MSSFIQRRLQLVEKLLDYASSQLAQDKVQLFGEFVRLYFSQMPIDDLDNRQLSDLYGIAYSHWELMYQRKPGEMKIHVFNPQFEQDGWQSTHTIIQIVADDMPFIVDSVRMELERLKLTTHLMIFSGGIKVKRSASGQVEALYAFHNTDANNSQTESPFYVEVDRQTDLKTLNEIKRNLSRVLGDVLLAVTDWKAMCARVRESINVLDPKSMKQDPAEINETRAFLNWLIDDHFTFLGYRDYDLVGEGAEQALQLIPNSGLGVLRDDTHSKMLRQYSDLPKKARELALSTSQIIIISKTNTMSTVHRPAYTDYIGIKRFDTEGKLVGERRFIGLYTSEAYRMDPDDIPLIRDKSAWIHKKSKLPRSSHAGKDLTHIIATLPRDDLFHAPQDELFHICVGILQMQERRTTRLFVRKDAYGRFISCLLFLPRENLDSSRLMRVEEMLKTVFRALDISQNTFVTDSPLARVHFVVRVNPRRRLHYDERELEKEVAEITASWGDEFRHEVLDYFGEERGNQLIEKYADSAPAGYREVFEPRVAVYDIDHIEKLKDNNTLGMSFYRPLGASKEVIRFKLYRLGSTVPLSDAVPMLENMGLRVVGEQPYQIVLKDKSQVWINDFGMSFNREPTFEVENVKQAFQDAFQSIWRGCAENDMFNRLVLQAQMTWREISVLRAYAKYFRQMGFAFSEQYIAGTLINNHKLAKLLVEFFIARFNPAFEDCREEKRKTVLEKIETALDKVVILDEDRILRRYLALIDATLRTNFFQTTNEGSFKSYLSFKLSPEKIPGLSLPLPKYEIYVYSPRFEGVHLRAAKVARGGIRWSDRREDFRTEVLGLMKAQQVKNAVIIPAGAKGGFVPKCLPTDGKREAILQEGISCYEDFIRGLLDVTDNLIDNNVISVKNTICYDGEDPYIVVAADKGTATFSDIANRISEERCYWLGDAFASGGSTGYDHKKMAITARGAWVSAERHFQNLGINVDKNEITVVGIGDMSGDVFGNGMLMSPHIKLVAAFNHLHIFIDPTPNAAISYAERKRLFELPRSTWDDYDSRLISKGGGVYSRFSKAICLSDELKTLLNVKDNRLEPNDLIKALLKSSVDLIWNGGIGTYVKASTEINADVGDRGNDAVRVDGKDLQARVICEGGNLGLTQLGRIEYNLAGGRLNTDFIDNSAGVDCSDHEVNIKVLLNDIVHCGDMTCKQRNLLLAEMTDEVAKLVLQNNYSQNRLISQTGYNSERMLGLFMRYLQTQEAAGKINRELEFIPSDKELLERRSMGGGLTSAEISVLLAYSKIILKDDIIQSNLVSDSFLANIMVNIFPVQLRKKYTASIKTHYLAKEILATQISNNMVSEMGITFAYQMQDEMSVPIDDIVRSYVAAREIFHLDDLYADIKSLDYIVDADFQYRMMYEGVRLVRRSVRWFLRNRRDSFNVQDSIEEFSLHVQNITDRLPKLLLGVSKVRFDEHVNTLTDKNVPHSVALKVAGMARIYHSLNIIEAASVHNADVFRVAKIYFMLVDRLDLLWFRDQINAYPVTDRWSVLAKAAYKGDLDWVQRALTVGVLRIKARSIPGKVNAWLERHTDSIDRWKSIISDLRSSERKEFAILFVAIRELLDLAENSMRDNYKAGASESNEEGTGYATWSGTDSDGM